ncbi:MAG: transglycosylase SLT domain-containing protein [Cryomorphaceae bacterium]
MNVNILKLSCFSCLAIFIVGCGGGIDSSDDNELIGDSLQSTAVLDSVRARGKLRALTTYSATSYFLYKGRAMGFEYELLQRFADDLGVELEIAISSDIDSLLYALDSGDVDIVAHGLTVTRDRQKQAAFTDYLYLTHQVLVQRKPENWRRMHWSAVDRSLIHDAIELIGDTVSVRRNSSYFDRLVNLSQEIGGEIVIDTLPGSLSTEEIIKMVVDGKIKYTVADNNIAAVNAAYYPILNVDVPVSFSQRVAWALRRDAPELLSATNEWIGRLKKGSDYYVIFNNYFKNRRGYRARAKSEFYSLTNNTISPYDDIIRRNAERIGWDWRLVASLIYQESQFEPGAKAWSDATGLMQIMPATAEELGVIDRSDPVQSIRGGTTYLNRLYSRFDEVPDSLQRVKFTMAAYNCGFGHVRDAQRLAEKRGLNPMVWDSNVDEMILALSYPQNYNDPVVYYGYVRGIEPYNYVSQIFDRYGHYSRFVD